MGATEERSCATSCAKSRRTAARRGDAGPVRHQSRRAGRTRRLLDRPEIIAAVGEDVLDDLRAKLGLKSTRAALARPPVDSAGLALLRPAQRRAVVLGKLRDESRRLIADASPGSPRGRLRGDERRSGVVSP